MSFDVYKISYEFSSSRNLSSLFVATDSETDGTTMLVYGDLQRGMQVQVIGHDNPEKIPGYIGRELIGTIEIAELEDVASVAWNTLAPWKQLDHLGRRLRPNRLWYRGEDWFNDAVTTLKDWGLLIT